MIERYLKKKNDYLCSHGVKYMFPNADHRHYYFTKCVVASVMAIFTYRFSIIYSAVAFALGLIIPDIIICISNHFDNENMFSDIESMYEIMRIQARAGVYVKDSLMDCYINSSNLRLKSAVLELCNNIGTNSTMDEAVNEFKRKFTNRHIDILCIVLSQAQTSGRAVQILTDMTEQINQLKYQCAKKDEGKLERKIEFLELLIFAGILAIGIYSMGNEIAKMFKI